MTYHDTGSTIVPADDTSAIECCADESKVIVEVTDGYQVVFRSEPIEIIALELAVDCARHSQPPAADPGA